MPRFDLGDALPSPGAAPPAAPPDAPPPARVKLTWTAGGAVRVLHLFLTPTVEAGRHSSRPLCLRIEPAADPVNLEKTKKISGHQFTLRVQGGGVELLDAGSSNGTFLGKERLAPQQPRRLDAAVTATVADVLGLEFQPVFSDSAGYLRIVRKNNPTGEEYALLVAAGGIGPTAGALVPLDAPGRAQPRRRLFDVGEAAAGDPARLLLREGRLYLERLGEEAVSFAGQALQPGRPAPVTTGGDVVLAGATIKVEV